MTSLVLWVVSAPFFVGALNDRFFVGGVGCLSHHLGAFERLGRIEILGSIQVHENKVRSSR